MNGPEDTARQTSRRQLVLAGTFALEPIERPLRFWIERLDLPLDIHLAPYNQVLQQMLDPASGFATNNTGINILLLRPEDCLRELAAASSPSTRYDHMERTVEEWLHALAGHRASSTASLFVLMPPASHSVHVSDPADLAAIRGDLEQALQAIAGVSFLPHSTVQDLYPVETCIDDNTNEIAHVPFTNDYFVAMATLLIRRIVGLLRPAHKVLAVDCDNTLWEGACGEISPHELRLSADRIRFQRMLITQQAMGVILCLCSKNSPADVEAVFSSRPDMPLRLEHFISHRINWEPKSGNLVSLADELNLGLDSFIFIDDNPVECAEVKSRCPAVQTLRAPTDPDDFHEFILHTWIFDVTTVTSDAARRATYYRQQRQRAAFMAETGNFDAFLAGLKLEVFVRPLLSENLDRAAELVVRTNQFNLTTIRRLPGEIADLVRQKNFHALTVNVSDRFGDYGLTGLAFMRISGRVAEVDTLLLSCRVLGRGVEATVVNHLSQWASERGMRHIQFEYRRSSRNIPAMKFLRRAFGQFEEETAFGAIYEVPVPFAIPLTPTQEIAATGAAESALSVAEPVSHRWIGQPASLIRVSDIAREIQRHYSLARKSDVTEPRRPAGVVEESLAQLWQQLLGRDAVDRNSGFMELGGNSVLMVQLTALIARSLGAKPSLAAVLSCHSLAEMAQLVEALRPKAQIERDVEIEEGTI